MGLNALFLFRTIGFLIFKRDKEIEWKKIAGLRDILVHQYFKVDMDILWDVVRTKVPELRKKLNDILGEERRS